MSVHVCVRERWRERDGEKEGKLLGMNDRALELTSGADGLASDLAVQVMHQMLEGMSVSIYVCYVTLSRDIMVKGSETSETHIFFFKWSHSSRHLNLQEVT